MGWQPTPETGELPPWRRAGGAGENPTRASGEGGSGRVLEHEEAVGDWFEEAEERGAHQKRRLHGGGTLSVGTRRRRLGTVVRAANCAFGEHRGAGGVLGEVSTGSDGDRRQRLWEGPRWRMVGLRPLHAVQRLGSRMKLRSRQRDAVADKQRQAMQWRAAKVRWRSGARGAAPREEGGRPELGRQRLLLWCGL
jgi:hypothetical protein